MISSALYPSDYPSDSRFLADGTNLVWELAQSPRPERAGGAWGTHWWLVRSEEAVAYCKTVARPGENEELILMDIEVREDCRQQGLAKALTAAVEAVAGATLYSTGNWTRAGSLALRHLPLVADAEPGVWYEEGTFVEDWADLRPRYA